ncbi:DUF4198 domain-containing protein [Pseudodesulfovibrio tunisiensis]|uniref:DUF4198 domain-containing protein n=1 Tax=Pseudodesulfovibrio tunisiensis TaxID=463192 RepID=UPI001FB50B07|nr:DUF4198 domain-containing protein [Pseudodesulfovibrio tunisiensis]
MKKRIVFTLMFALALLCGPASAHEFLLKPVQCTAQKGAIVPFSVVSAHVFMISEEMEPPAQVEVEMLLAGKKTALSLTPNEVLMTLDGRVEPLHEGTAILAGHRKGVIWTQTKRGWKQASKKGLKGVIHSGKYEKFCKTLMTVGKPDNAYGTVVGHALEIVPVTDPTQAKPGDEIEFTFLYQGRPFVPESMVATYDGFTLTPNTFAYFTEPYGEGRARLKITAPGVWMVRVQHVLDQPTEEYDSHVMRAVLAFEVK